MFMPLPRARRAACWVGPTLMEAGEAAVPACAPLRKKAMLREMPPGSSAPSVYFTSRRRSAASVWLGRCRRSMAWIAWSSCSTEVRYCSRAANSGVSSTARVSLRPSSPPCTGGATHSPPMMSSPVLASCATPVISLARA